MKEYFSHDYNARNDTKLVKVFMKHGLLGIGAYWCIIEMLFEESGYLIRTEYERIAFELRTDNETIQSIVENYELFEFDDTKFWSNSALERLEQRMDKSAKARASVEKRWAKHKNDTNVLQSNNDRNTSKVKESKVKESKVKEKREKDFIYFWSVYPNKIAKAKCKEKFIKLNQNEVDKIISTIDSFVKYKPFENYNHPNPETYINQKRWDDEIKLNSSRSNISDSFNLTEYLIPNDDSFGLEQGELIKRCKEGFYKKAF